ncbi:MAG: hypothetical protein WKH64_07295 [Chloroflexia bacterium]
MAIELKKVQRIHKVALTWPSCRDWPGMTWDDAQAMYKHSHWTYNEYRCDELSVAADMRMGAGGSNAATCARPGTSHNQSAPGRLTRPPPNAKVAQTANRRTRSPSSIEHAKRGLEFRSR